MAPPLVTGRRRALRQLAGLLFLAVLAGIIVLTAAIYQKAFTPVVMVAVETTAIGNQLTTGGDVKARGLVVGDIREVSTDGSGARIDIALDPEAAKQIPKDTRVRLLPKTLFGEKFVSLEFEDDSTADHLEDGDVIQQDRTQLARETEEALNDLLPLLRTLRPADLSVTLNALSSALRGRGDQLGENLELVDSYLREFNPEIAALGENFGGVADFVDNLEASRADILALLDNASAINRNLVDQEQELNTFLNATTGFALEMGDFLQENEQRLISLAADSRPSLELYEKYAPEYPCLFKGLDVQMELAENVFGGLQPGLHITLEFTEDQGSYQPEADEPAYGEDAGPTCRGLPPNDPIRPFPVDQEVTDGYCDEEEKAPGIQNGCRTGAESEPHSPSDDPARALAQRDRDKAVVNAVIGPVMGVAPAEVPDLGVLLFGPLARGTQVGLSTSR